MACPVCGRTMQNLGSDDRRIFWCQYCGTLKEESGEFHRYELPGLLRHVVAVAKLPAAAEDSTSGTTVSAEFRIRQVRKEPTPRVELAVFGPDGRRVL